MLNIEWNTTNHEVGMQLNDATMKVHELDETNRNNNRPGDNVIDWLRNKNWKECTLMMNYVSVLSLIQRFWAPKVASWFTCDIRDQINLSYTICISTEPRSLCTSPIDLSTFPFEFHTHNGSIGRFVFDILVIFRCGHVQHHQLILRS